MRSKIGFQPFLNVFDLSMVNKSCCHKNAVISENCIKSGIVAAHRKLICFEARLCELTFSKVSRKYKHVQKLNAKNTDGKASKSDQNFRFFIFYMC